MHPLISPGAASPGVVDPDIVILDTAAVAAEKAGDVLPIVGPNTPPSSSHIPAAVLDDPAADPTAGLRAVANALTMHTTIHSGIAAHERALCDIDEPNEVFAEIHARIASLAPRHQAVADAARDVTVALRAIVDAIDEAMITTTHPADHARRCTGTRGDDLTPTRGGSMVALYDTARRQLRASWSLLPEFHQMFDELHLAEFGPNTQLRPSRP